MSRKCAFTHKNSTLARLMHKHGQLEGFRIYHQESKIKGTLDADIEAKHLQLETAQYQSPIGVNLASQRSESPAAEYIENDLGIAKWTETSEGMTRSYSNMSKAEAKKLRDKAQDYIENIGMEDTFRAVIGLSPNKRGHQVRVEENSNEYLLVGNANVPFLDQLNRQKQEVTKKLKKLKDELRTSDLSYESEQINLAYQSSLNAKREDINSQISDYLGSFKVSDLVDNLQNDDLWMRNFLSKSRYSMAELREAIEKLEVWQAASEPPKDGKHPFLDDEELKDKDFTKRFIGQSRAFQEKYSDHIYRRRNDAILQFTREHAITDNMSDDEILEILQDMNLLRKNFVNIGQAHQPMLQALFVKVSEVNNQYQRKAQKDLDRLLELAKIVSPNDMLKFRQRDDKGRFTRYLVNPYSSQYFDERSQVLSALSSARAFEENLDAKSSKGMVKAAKKQKQEASKDAADWYKRTHVNLSPSGRIKDIDTTGGMLPTKYLNIAEESQDSKDELEQILSQAVGGREATELQRRMKTRVQKFQAARDAFYLELLGTRSPEQGLTDRDTETFEFWLAQHSPYEVTAEQPAPLKSYKDEDGYLLKSYANYEFVASMPNPNRSEYFDENYLDIMGDSATAELYDMFRGFINEGRNMLGDIDGFLGDLSIPLMEESLYKQMTVNGPTGLMASGTYMKDSIIRAIREANSNEFIDQRINPATNRETKSVNISSVSVSNFKRLVSKKKAELVQDYKEKNAGAYPESDVLQELEKNAIDQLYQESSSNLIGAFAMYRVNTLMAGQRRTLEPVSAIMTSYVGSMEVEAGEIQGQGLAPEILKGRKREKGEAKNMMDALEFFLDEKVYGLSTKKKGIKLGTALTSEEKKQAAEVQQELEQLEEKIEQLEDIQASGRNFTVDEQMDYDQLKGQKAKLEKLYESIGGQVSPTKVADGLIRLNQALGIGLSVPSAVANTGFGFIANNMEAAKGRDLTTGSLHRAYKLVLGKVGSSHATFNPRNAELAVKIAEIARDYQIGLPPLEQRPQTSYRKFGSKNRLGKVKEGKTMEEGLYKLMEKTEYINQATLMTGIMMDTEVVLEDGTTNTLLEAYTNEEIGPEKIKTYKIVGGDQHRDFSADKFFVYVRNVVERVHGDYNNKVPFKKNLLGRALSQYKTWMFRTVADRFDVQRYDGIAGYTTKGRYRSAVPLGAVPFFNMLIPPLVLAQKKGQKNTKLGFTDKASIIAGNSLSTVKAFGAAMLKNPFKFNKYLKQELQKEFDKVDAENIAATYSEWLIYMTIGVFSKLMLAAAMSAFDEDDDELTLAKGSAIFSLNMLNRFQNDISFYLNPLEAGRLVDNPIPAYYLQDKGQKLYDSVGRLFDDRPMEIQSGIYEGWWWPIRDAVKLTPGVIGFDKLYRNATANLQTGKKVTDFSVFSDQSMIDSMLGLKKEKED